MSASGNEFREAEYLGLGFLAVTSSELLDQFLHGQSIEDEDDRYTLRRAETFLREVSNGARLVTSGVSSDASAIETVRKLTYSVEPLKLIQDGIRSADVGQTFEDMAHAIDSAVTGDMDQAERGSLVAAMNFFRQLHVFLIAQIEANQRRTSGDWSFGPTPPVHA